MLSKSKTITVDKDCLTCPNPKTPDYRHPRVFIKFDSKGEFMCPYCGIKYSLTSS